MLAAGGSRCSPAASSRPTSPGSSAGPRAVLRSGDRGRVRSCGAEYPGDLLPDLPYEEWTQAPRERLRACTSSCCGSAGEWERLVEVEPADEQAYRELMRAALRRGRPARRDPLVRAAAHDPGSASSACRPGGEPGAVRGVRRRSGRPTPAVVGRQLELARMAAACVRPRGRPAGRAGRCAARPASASRRCAARSPSSARDAGWRVVDGRREPGPRRLRAAVPPPCEQLLSRDRGAARRGSPATRAVLAELTALAGPAPPAPGELTRHMVIGAVHRLLAARRGRPGRAAGRRRRAPGRRGHGRGMANSWSGPAVGCRSWSSLAYRPESARQALTRAVAGLDRAGRCTDDRPRPARPRRRSSRWSGRAPTPRPACRPDRRDGAGQPVLRPGAARGVGAGTRLSRRRPGTRSPTRFLDLDDADGGDAAPARGGRRRPGPGRRARADRAARAGRRSRCSTPRSTPARWSSPAPATGSGTTWCARPSSSRSRRTSGSRIHRDAARRLAAAGAAPAWSPGTGWTAAARTRPSRWLLAAARRASRSARSPTRSASSIPCWSTGRSTATRCACGPRCSTRSATAGRPPPTPPPRRSSAGRRRTTCGRCRRWPRSSRVTRPAALRDAGRAGAGDGAGQARPGAGLSGAAVMGFADPASSGTAKAAECRRLALESGDRTALVVASWAQAAAAHARGDLREQRLGRPARHARAARAGGQRLRRAALHDPAAALRGAAVPRRDRVRRGRSAPRRSGSAPARGRAFAVTLRGEAKLLSGALDEADADLREAARLSRAIGAATGEALALQRRAEVALHRGRPGGGGRAARRGAGRRPRVRRRLPPARPHLRRPGSPPPPTRPPRWSARRGRSGGPRARWRPAPAAGSRSPSPPRSPPPAPATSTARPLRAGAPRRSPTVVMRLPAWDAALEEVKGHLAAARSDAGRGRALPRGGRGFARRGPAPGRRPVRRPRQERSRNTRLTSSAA